MKAHIFKSVFIILFVCSSLFSAELPLDSNSLVVTVYDKNLAVVKERRLITFDKGINRIKLSNLPLSIDPTGIIFDCVSPSAKIAILERNYEYDLTSTSSILNRYTDRIVRIFLKGSGAEQGGEIVGTLIAVRDNNLILNVGRKLEIINESNIERISLDQVSENLITKPTLFLLAESDRAGDALCQLTYPVSNINWKADYSAILNADENAVDISCWIAIDNRSGKDYRDARIKLVAGDIRYLEEHRMKMMDFRSAVPAAAPDFLEKSFMEYHIYTLQRPATVNDNQTKQMEFFAPVLNLPAEKVYIYDRSKNDKKVQIRFEIENKKQTGLGIALPKGVVRVYKKDTDGLLEFAGEDFVDHTAIGEKMSVCIGNAFDIAVEYKLLDSKIDRRMRQDRHQIEFRNHRNSPITIFVDEKFPPMVNWTIEQATHSYVKKDATTARFTVDIPADSNAVLEYSATQQWYSYQQQQF